MSSSSEDDSEEDRDDDASVSQRSTPIKLLTESGESSRTQEVCSHLGNLGTWEIEINLSIVKQIQIFLIVIKTEF